MIDEWIKSHGLLTARELASQLGCHPATVLRIARRRKLGLTLGTRRYFQRADQQEIRENVHPSRGNPAGWSYDRKKFPKKKPKKNKGKRAISGKSGKK